MTDPPPHPALDQSDDPPPSLALDQPKDPSPTLEDHVGTTIDTLLGDKGTQQTKDSSSQSTPYLRGPTSLATLMDAHWFILQEEGK